MLATILYLLPFSLPAFVTLGESVCQVLWCLALLNSCSCWRVNLTNKLCMCLRFFFRLNVLVLVAQSCLILCDPMDCSPPGSSVHEILQATVLEWVAISFSRGSSWPRDQTQVSCTAGRFFTDWTTREAQTKYILALSKQPRQGLPRRYKGLSTLKMQVGCIQGWRNPVQLALCFCYVHYCYSVLSPSCTDWNQMLHSAETPRLCSSQYWTIWHRF